MKIPTGRELNNIPLQAALEGLGATLASGSRLSHQTKMWSVGGLKIGVTGHVWFCNTTKHGGVGPLKLVQHIRGCDYFAARDFLTPLLGCENSPSYMAFNCSSIQPTAPQTPPPRIIFEESHWPVVRKYLTSTRCLSTNLVDHLHAAGQIGATSYQALNGSIFVNAAFAREYGGAFVRGCRGNYKGTVGNKAGGSFIIKSSSEAGVALVEAPIDSLSLHQLQPHLTVIATGGSIISPSDALRGITPNLPIFGAFDSDQAGDQYFKTLITTHPTAKRLRPPGGCKDWNEVLQRQPEVVVAC